jgi:hypothetical protein
VWCNKGNGVKGDIHCNYREGKHKKDMNNTFLIDLI